MAEQQSSIPGLTVGRATLGPEVIHNRFGFHKATTEGENATLPQHQDLREAAIEFAEYLDSVLVDGREKDIAMEQLETAVMWAHKAIAQGAILAPEGEYVDEE